MINTVTHDNKKIIADAVEFLMANGHKRIAYISGPQNDYSSGAQRLKAFYEITKNFNLDIPDSYVVEGDFSYESGMNAMQCIYEESLVLPTAVLACCDMTAIGAIACIRKFGMKVPESLSVMGIDDTELAQYVTPSLSTIRIPYYEEGRKAARELLTLIEEEKQSTESLVYVPHKIIRRFSVKNIG